MGTGHAHIHNGHLPKVSLLNSRAAETSFVKRGGESSGGIPQLEQRMWGRGTLEASEKVLQ